MDLGDIRNEYEYTALSKSLVLENPFEQSKVWINEAIRQEINEPTAMTLATAGKNLRPSARIVLLKKIESKGFVFFTDYGSRKAQDLAENNQAALLFFWPELFRQIRIEGKMERIAEEQAEVYFNSRPLKSQISSIISEQSQIVPNRDYLQKKWEEWSVKSSDEIKKPQNWGGFILIPDYFEFWQGRKNRFHDRIIYQKEGRSWIIERLAP